MTKAIPVPVTLVPGTDQQGNFVWQMGVNGAAPQGPPYPPITVDHGNTATITFTVQNGPGQNISFASVPMLVPPKSNGIDMPILNGTGMTFTDHNLKQADVPYVLVFNGAPKLDPIIKNDGGGSLAFADYVARPAVDLAVLVAVAVLVFLIARAIYRKGTA